MLCPTVAIKVVFALGDINTIAVTEAGNVETFPYALTFVGASGRGILVLVYVKQLIWWI